MSVNGYTSLTPEAVKNLSWLLKNAKERTEFKQTNYPLWEELSLLKKQSKGLMHEEIEHRFNAIFEKYEP